MLADRGGMIKHRVGGWRMLSTVFHHGDSLFRKDGRPEKGFLLFGRCDVVGVEFREAEFFAIVVVDAQPDLTPA